jgi:hypothetical protein
MLALSRKKNIKNAQKFGRFVKVLRQFSGGKKRGGRTFKRPAGIYQFVFSGKTNSSIELGSSDEFRNFCPPPPATPAQAT